VSTFELDALGASADDGPVTMLNLVKYRDRSTDGNGSGRDAYQRYASVAQGLVESRGGRVLWAGVLAEAALNEGQGDADWDWALLVYYPDRAAFIDMVTSPEYLAANQHRLAGVEKHLIVSSNTLMLQPFPAT
jgi:uncharacterized protein (DUF1330 family)